VPFTFGGGVDSLEKMKDIIQAGAEKVVFNSAAVENPSLISDAASKFGSQCIVVSIDALKLNNSYKVFIRNGTELTNLDPVKWAKEVESRGAGEILINSIAHDGMQKGYNLELITKVADSVNIPVIAAGGAASIKDCVEIIKKGKASAVSAGSIFHYTKFTPNMIKGALHDAGIPVRMYDDIDYDYSW
jgi:cyclase